MSNQECVITLFSQIKTFNLNLKSYSKNKRKSRIITKKVFDAALLGLLILWYHFHSMNIRAVSAS